MTNYHCAIRRKILQNLLVYVNNLPIFEFFNLGFFAYDDKIKDTKTTKRKTMKNFKRIKWKMRKKTSVTFLHLSSACILLQITVQCEITRRRRKKGGKNYQQHEGLKSVMTSCERKIALSPEGIR